MTVSVNSIGGGTETGTAPSVDRAMELCNALDTELTKSFVGDLQAAKQFASTLNGIAMQLRMQVQTGSRNVQERALVLITKANDLLGSMNKQYTDDGIAAIIEKMRDRITALTPKAE